MHKISRRSLWLLSAVLISLLVSSCGPGQFLGPTITPSPTFTPTPTLTPSPTATLTPIPSTATPTLDATVGQINGVLIDSASQEPVEGKQIILAMAVETGGEVSMQWNINTSPKVQSESDGAFLFTDLPPGRYILVLDPIFALMDEGKFYIIEVEAGQSVDLGTILVNGNVPQLP